MRTNMLRSLRLGWLAAAVLCCPAVVRAAGPPPALIPQPVELTRLDGSLRLHDGDFIGVPANDAAALHSAHRLADLAQRFRGLRLRVGGGASARIVLERPAAALSAEAYTLDVSPATVRLAATDDAGLDDGVATLLQLLTPDGGRGDVELPALHIADAPRFAWRGLMLDVARHYAAPQEIERLLDQMALHKLNVFHWHLTDDQGWRIEIKRYPDLTRIGGWRTPPGGRPARYGGVYTQAQVHDIVAYAARLHITVVPEIDMPGHAQAAVAAYPQFGAAPAGFAARPKVSVDWGVNPYLYNIDDATLAFIDNLLDEIMALFPSTFIHVGGDEAVKDAWKQSPVAQKRMRALGLHTEDELQSWFIGRIGEHLASRGRRLIGWDEILEGGLPPTASVMSWRGTDGAVAAAKQGHDVVLAPAGALYFDNLQSPRGDEPAGRIAQLPIEKVYAFEPMDGRLDAVQAQHVLGLEAALWTEYMTSPWHRAHALYPRLSALAEVAWSPPSTRDWGSFVPRLAVQMQRYRRQGVDAADSAFAVADAASSSSVSLTSDRFNACPNQELGLRVPLFPDATTRAPVFNINIFDGCWIVPGVALDGMTRLTLHAARLARNYGLAHDAVKVVRHSARSAAGEIEVHLDTCDGTLLAALPLPQGKRLETLRLTAPLPESGGTHDLCLQSTAPIDGPFYAIDRIEAAVPRESGR